MNHDDSGYLPIGPSVPPRQQREFMGATEIDYLGGLIFALNKSGAQITGTLEYKGHSFPLAYDSTKKEHVVAL